MTADIQEESYQLFFTQFPEGIIRINTQGVILDMNYRAELLLGWEKSELSTTHIHDYLCPEAAELSHIAAKCLFSEETIKKLIDNMNNSTDLFEQYEQWWVRKDGEYINVDIKLFIVINRQGEQEIILFFSDCSEKKFSHKETENLSQFPELNPSPVLQVNTEAVITYANPAMTTLMADYGFSEQGIPNVMPDDLQQIIERCNHDNSSIINIEKHYEQKWYNWNFHKVSKNGQTLFQVYGMDITARKENELHLKKLKELAEQSNQHKTTFFANMSHELRSPLNGMIGMSKLLEETALNDIQKDYIQNIQKSAESLLMIINDVLDIAKIEAGKLEIVNEPFDLIEVVYDTVGVLDYQRLEKKQRLDIRIDPHIEKELIGDALRIRQILLNFLTNAVKFTPESGRIFLNISLHETGEHLPNNQLCLHFAVSDSGIGIAEEKRKQLFKQFVQADKNTTHKYGGTGLGLSICKELSRLMHGEVGVESSPGHGSTFWLELPLEKVPRKIHSLPLINLLKDKSCYLINNDAVNSNILIELLEFWAMSCQHFKDISSAIGAISQLPADSTSAPDFVLVSLEEDETDRLEQIRETSQQYCSRIICILNQTHHQIIEKLDRAGVEAYVINPFRPEKLKQLMVYLSDKNLQLEHIISSHLFDRQEVAPVPSSRPLEVLLVEDNPINQKIAQAMLNKLGAEVVLASDGEQAVEKFQQQPFDLVLMDCHLPVKDGYQCTREIRALEAKRNQQPTTVIALTANSEDEVGVQVRESGMDGLLSKPIDRLKLQQIINTIKEKK